MKYSLVDDMKISDFVLGTDGYGEVTTKETAFELMDLYKQSGGNTLDTARLYCNGSTEALIGDWIRSRGKNDMFIATKGGHPNLDTMNVPRLSLKELESDIDKSLFALGIDCIDFFWLHRDSLLVNTGEIIESLNLLAKKGKIRKFGCSNWHSERINEANLYAKEHSLSGFCASQIRFSPASTAPDYVGDLTLIEMNKKEFEFYKETSIPVMAFASQAKGFFSKYLSLGIEGLSKKAKERYYCDENVKKSEYVSALSEKYNVSAAAIVCAALISIRDFNVFPIIGGKNLNQIKQSLEGANLQLTEDEVKNLIYFI